MKWDSHGRFELAHHQRGFQHFGLWSQIAFSLPGVAQCAYKCAQVQLIQVLHIAPVFVSHLGSWGLHCDALHMKCPFGYKYGDYHRQVVLWISTVLHETSMLL